MMRKPLLVLGIVGVVISATEWSLPDSCHRLAGALVTNEALTKPLQGPQPPVSVVAVWIGSQAGQDSFWINRIMGLAVALSVVVSALTAWRVAGGLAGLFAALIMLAYPGVLFHGRTVGPEAFALLSFSLLIATWCLNANRISTALLGVLAFTMALGSSHESLALALAWILCCFWRNDSEEDASAHGGWLSMGPLEPSLLVPLIAAPAILFMLWPYLDVSTGKRAVTYFLSPFLEQHPAWLVLGDVRDQAVGRGPTTLQGIMHSLIRIPALTAVLALVGMRSLGRTYNFIVLGLVSLICLHALNGSPWYAGTNAAMNCVPFLAILSGIGASRLISSLARIADVYSRIPHRLVTICSSVLILTPSALETAVAYPLEQGYTNAFTGGSWGASAFEIETHPDVFLTNVTLNSFNSELPDNARVAFYPLSKQYKTLLATLQNVGLVRSDIVITDEYYATHLAVPRVPADPLYSDVTRWWNSPLMSFEHNGVVFLSLHRY